MFYNDWELCMLVLDTTLNSWTDFVCTWHLSLPDCFLTSASCHQEAVEQAIMALQMDRDSDVKYFASIHPASTKISEDAMSTASSTY